MNQPQIRVKVLHVADLSPRNTYNLYCSWTCPSHWLEDFFYAGNFPSHWTLTLINEIHGRLRSDVRQTRKKPLDRARLRHVLTDFNRADDDKAKLPASRGLHCELETLGVEKGLLRTYKKSPRPRYPLIDVFTSRGHTILYAQKREDDLFESRCSL